MTAQTYGPAGGGYDSEFTAGRGGDIDATAAEASAEARNALNDAAVSGDVIQARAQVEQTRAEMSDTIDAIKEKLSPQHMAAEAKEAVVTKAHDAWSGAVHSAQEMASNVKDTIKDSASRAMDSVTPTLRGAGESAKGAGETIVETIRLNPIPAAITGIGLGWLIMSMRRQNESGTDMAARSYDADRFASAADEFGAQESSDQPSAMDNIKGTLGDAKDKVAQTASDVANNVAASASDLAHNVGDKASALGTQAKDVSQRAMGATSDYAQANPLMVGALALLAGAAVGLMLPGTEPENRWMGETRDRWKDQAAQQFHQVADKVQNVASAAFDQAKTTVTQTVQQEAQNQGLTTASA